MIRKILVPLDGSPFAGQALTTAAALAGRTGASIHLLHVREPSGSSSDDETEENAYLNRFVERLGTLGLDAKSHLRKGQVAQTIAGFATENDVDLLVLSTHGRGRLSQCWLGSVADELVRRLPLPMLLIRPSNTPTDALGAELTLKKMLVSVDPQYGPGCSEIVAEVGRAIGGEVCVMSVATPVATPGFDWPATSSADETLERRRKAAQDAVDRCGETLRAAGCSPRSTVVIGAHIASSILDAVAKEPFELLALGIPAANVDAGVFVGDVADKVVRGATCATLLYRLDA